MKTIHFYMVLALLLLLLSGCGSVEEFRDTASKETEHLPAPGTAIDSITGEVVDTQQSLTLKMADGREVSITVQNGEVPMTQVLSACGIELSRPDADTVEFTLDEKHYILSLTGLYLTADDAPDYNLILPPPGTTDPVLFSREGELYVDQSTMNGVLFELGFRGDNQASIVGGASQNDSHIRQHLVQGESKRRIFLRPINNEGTGTFLEVTNEEIPLTQVLEARGVELSWTDEDHAEFNIGGINYTLCISQCEICETGYDDYNAIFLPPFLERPFIFPRDHEIYMDLDTLNLVLGRLGPISSDSDNSYTVIWEEDMRSTDRAP